MALNPDMQSMSQQLDALRQSQSQQGGMLAGAISSLQQTIQDLANATRMGVATAQQSGGTALQSLQYGAMTAMGDVQAFGGALARMAPPGGPAPDITGMAMPMGGGMMVGGGVDVVHGAAVGALALGGGAAGFAAWTLPFGRAMRGGAAVGRALAGTGIRGAIGAGLGGGLALTGVGAVALGAGLAIDYAVETGIEHMNATRDINAVMRQQMWRNAPFDPNVNMATANYRGIARQTALDISQMKGMSAADATSIVGGGMELGLFQGVGSEGIRERATELAKAVKDMTRLLGTSMEESLTLMAEIKQVGFDPAAAPGVILASRGMGRAAGFTASEMHMAGMRGAQMFRGTALGAQFGYNAAQASLATASDLTLRGAIPNDLVANMGGRQAMGEAMGATLGRFAGGGLGMFLDLSGPGGSLQDRLNRAQSRLSQMNLAEQLSFLGTAGQRLGRMDPAALQREQVEIFLGQIPGDLAQELGQLGAEDRVGALAALAVRTRGLGITNINEGRVFAAMALNPQTWEARAQAMKSELQRDRMDQFIENRGGFLGAFAPRFRGGLTVLSNDLQGLASEWIAKPVSGASETLESMTSSVYNKVLGVETRTVTAGMLQLSTEARARGETPTTFQGIVDPAAIQRIRLAGGISRAPTTGNLIPGIEPGEEMFDPNVTGGIQDQIAAVKQLQDGSVKYRQAEVEARDNAIKQIMGPESKLGGKANVWFENMFDKSLPIAVRHKFMEHLSENILMLNPKLPGGTKTQQMAFIMSAFGQDALGKELWKFAGKELQIQDVQEFTPAEEKAEEELESNLRAMSRNAFPDVGFFATAEKQLLRKEIVNIRDWAKLGPTQQAALARRIGEAEGITTPEAFSAIKSLRESPFLPQTLQGLRVVAERARAEEPSGVTLGEIAVPKDEAARMKFFQQETETMKKISTAISESIKTQRVILDHLQKLGIGGGTPKVASSTPSHPESAEVGVGR